MKQSIEIRAVDFVRKIRDVQADELSKKSSAAIIEFFNGAGERAKRTRRSLKRVSIPANKLRILAARSRGKIRC